MKALRFLVAAALLPLPSIAQAAETEHVVGEGETLNGIANRAGVSAKALAEANGLKTPFALRTGQKLKIPAVAAKASVKTAAAAKPTTDGKASTSAPTKASAKTPLASTPDNPALAKENVHVVTQGETLGGIANRAKVPRVLIAEANGLTAPYDVRPGQKLLIPRTRRYVVRPGDTGFEIAYRHAVPWSQIAVANGLDANAAVVPGKELLIPTVLDPQLPSPADKAAVKTAATASAVASAAVAAAKAPAGRGVPRFAWPLEGTVRRSWKPTASADHHDGLDIVAPANSAVRAAAAGTVLFAGAEADQFGNLVVLDHGDGWNTAYGFLSRATVKKGEKVASGERIGVIGNTGKARGTELHFEVRQDGKPVDPEPELPKAP
ncbi:LysM peptidoglycan-binding domain-containing M23 family metallopeptidase [Novosphingobium sp. 9U]|uniref:LysM peptidoglycan-binding domain-containing M23 family metallopeptidase n=1 Tax=Novosphingobium sp. 9U TaxID=2653158 RepID=UPI0012F12114|nr:LysM peptidoglycan-binding domain-containing M23 family metallopeptidase [Novosphingobium sp. 9U]VWX47099.1 Membrane protein [Novosphingobium sp. 9U]